MLTWLKWLSTFFMNTHLKWRLYIYVCNLISKLLFNQGLKGSNAHIFRQKEDDFILISYCLWNKRFQTTWNCLKYYDWNAGFYFSYLHEFLAPYGWVRTPPPRTWCFVYFLSKIRENHWFVKLACLSSSVISKNVNTILSGFLFYTSPISRCRNKLLGLLTIINTWPLPSPFFCNSVYESRWTVQGPRTIRLISQRVSLVSIWAWHGSAETKLLLTFTCEWATHPITGLSVRCCRTANMYTSAHELGLIAIFLRLART